ncbi:hypothetical protein [Microbacterium sp. YY-01]|uniref:hypothetical protein n=1 Tax=Microbacterium sp. YY-01 TaxID=3421634 RepID=UPI003D167971
MIAREANVLLTKINARDKFPRWSTPEEMAFAAREWAEDLEHVALGDAVAAVRQHYAVSSERITVSDLLDACPVRDSSWAGNITEQRLAAEAAGRRALTPEVDGV